MALFSRAIAAGLSTLFLLYAADQSRLGPSAAWTSFENSAEIQQLKAQNANLSQSNAHATDGRSALRVSFAATAFPGFRFDFSENAKDWSKYSGFAVDVYNPEDQPVELRSRLDDDVSASGGPHSQGSLGLIPAQSAATAVILFRIPSPMSMGMRIAPRLPESVVFEKFGSNSIEPAHVTAALFYLDHPKQPHELYFDRLRLISPEPRELLYTRIIDQYGQFTKEDWPGKIHEDGDFERQRRDEARTLTDGPAGRDQYGGLLDSPRMTSRGFFRTEKRGPAWWLVTPEGHPFFSVGVDAVQLLTPVYIEGREWMFTGLPAESGALREHFAGADNSKTTPGGRRGFDSGRTFDFFKANLQRKYGQGYMGEWIKVSYDRLRAWGVNTIGNWSDPRVRRGAGSRGQRIPYVVTMDTAGDYARVHSPADYWGPLADPFDPRFADAVDARLKGPTLEHRDDPYVLGYFVDNELSWARGKNSAKDSEHFTLLIGVLSSGPESPAKRAWVEKLKARYGDVQGLNHAWQARFASWQDLLSNAYKPPSTLPTEEMRADFSTFLGEFASQYFRTIAATVHRYDPNHLYLGCRFAFFALEQVQACARECDVVSFNIYDRTLGRDWDFVNALNKPVIIGEFHFGALDRGGFAGGIKTVASQADRAHSYLDYMRSVAVLPAFVGAHWYEFQDEPLAGRGFDGENYQIGFLSVTDTPYPELVNAVKETSAKVYAWRTGELATR